MKLTKYQKDFLIYLETINNNTGLTIHEEHNIEDRTMSELNSNNVKVGTKLVAKNDYWVAIKGEVVEVTGFDCDGWPEYRNIQSGKSDCDGWNSMNNMFELATPSELEDKWIVWFSAGVYLEALQTSSEEAAKSAAERMVDNNPSATVYIAQACNSVAINRKVWSN